MVGILVLVFPLSCLERRHGPEDPDQCYCLQPSHCPPKSGLARCFRPVKCGVDPCPPLDL